MNIEKIFNKVFNGQKNLITPEIIEYGATNENLWELSTSNIFNVFGVTVIKFIDGQPIHQVELSQPFNTEKEAREYIKNL